VSARSEIRAALDRVAAELHRRYRLQVDAALLRVLRDYGLECHATGVQHAHTRSTIPAPAGDVHDELTGRYQIPHPHADDDDDEVNNG